MLPPLYDAWLTTLLDGPVPQEAAATCASCAMAPPDGAVPPAGAEYFDPRLKCCTYVPQLPNFLVGRILRDPDPALAFGRASLLARLSPGRHVSPLGVDAPAAFAALYRDGRDAAFGRAPAFRCPHLVEATDTCGIWRHRQAVCATWFCKFDRGQRGQRFWLAVLDLLRLAERALAMHCVRALAPEREVRARAIQQGRTAAGLDAESLGGPVDAEAHASTWGRYAGREREYFEACAAVVDGMSWPDVLAAGGAELALAADAVRDAYRALGHAALPGRLRVAPIQVTPLGPADVRCVGYSGLDPLEVPRALADVLHVFDGRPVAESLAAAAAAGVDLDRAVLRRLVDFGILEASPPSPRPQARTRPR